VAEGDWNPPDTGSRPDPEDDPPILGLSEPPSVTATADTLIGTAPLTVIFHGDVVTPLDLISTEWDFGDGSPITSDQAVQHMYSEPNTYYAKFTASNDIGSASKWIAIEVLSPDTDTQPGPGQAKATINVLTEEPYTAPALIRFEVDTTGIGESDIESSINYTWDFGDGNTGSGQTSENIYENPGFYSVVVQVQEVRSTGTTVTISASTFIQVEGLASFDPGTGAAGNITLLNEDEGSSGDDYNNTPQSGGACGSFGPAMIGIIGVSLFGLRRRMRRTI